MKKYFKITNPIYPFIFHVYIGFKTIDEIKANIKAKKKTDTKLIREKLDTLDWENSAGYAPECRGWIFILVKEFKGTPKCFDTLHHEIDHAVDASAEYIGIKHCDESKEYFAYMTGFITRIIHQKLKNGKDQ